MEPDATTCSYAQRFWIHTHPRHKAFMSSTDIMQLYSLNLIHPDLFGIVLSPRVEGIKALCVHLTAAGAKRVQEYFQETQDLKVADPVGYVRHSISQSVEEYYVQIPFQVADESSHVVDLRSEEEVKGQLRDFILSGAADDCWVSL